MMHDTETHTYGIWSSQGPTHNSAPCLCQFQRSEEMTQDLRKEDLSVLLWVPWSVPHLVRRWVPQSVPWSVSHLVRRWVRR